MQMQMYYTCMYGDLMMLKPVSDQRGADLPLSSAAVVLPCYEADLSSPQSRLKNIRIPRDHISALLTGTPLADKADKADTLRLIMQQNSTNEPEVAKLGDPLTGTSSSEFRAVAEQMNEDSYYACFRKFDYISTLRLISLQARLAKEESELKRLELVFPERATISDTDDTHDGNIVLYSPEQLRILDRSESLLRDYSESALRVKISTTQERLSRSRSALATECANRRSPTSE
jgi:hypothetical protein